MLSRILSSAFQPRAIIPLGAVSPQLSSDLPKSLQERECVLLLFLLQIGFVAQYISILWPTLKVGIFILFCIRRMPYTDGLFSVTLSVALRPPVFHWYLLLRSPDFPLLVSFASPAAIAYLPL